MPSLEVVPLTKPLTWRTTPRVTGWVADWSTPEIRSWAGVSDSGSNALRVLSSCGLISGWVEYPDGWDTLSYLRNWEAYFTFYRRPVTEKDIHAQPMNRALCYIDDELRENFGHFRIELDPSDFIWKVRLRFRHISSDPEKPDLKSPTVEAMFLPRYEELRADEGYAIGGTRHVR